MTKDEFIKIIKQNTPDMRNEIAIINALDKFLSEKNIEQSIVRKTFDGCSTCKNNVPGLQAGLWCINNCVSGSKYESYT